MYRAGASPENTSNETFVHWARKGISFVLLCVVSFQYYIVFKASNPSLSIYLGYKLCNHISDTRSRVAGRSTLELRLKSSALVDFVKIPSMISAAGRTQNKRHNNKVCYSSYAIYALFQLLCTTRSSFIFEVKMSV